MKKNKLLFIGLGALLIILIVVAVVKKKDGRELKVIAEKAGKRSLIETVSANGKIQPEKDIKITPYISGEVVQLLVKEGDQVTKGDLLAKIDPEIYVSVYEQRMASLNTQKANLANAKARLAQAKAKFLNDKLSFERNQKLFEEEVISDADFEQATANYEMAKADMDAAEQSVLASKFQVSNAEASLKQAKEDLDKTAIYSPASGTVSQLSVEQGERVSGASQFSIGTEIMRIANLDKMEANVDVNENDIVRVNLNDTALIEVDAYLNRKFKGLVSEIATSASNLNSVSVDQVTNFAVKIRLLPSSYADLTLGKPASYSPFRPGMSTTVDIQTTRAGDILTVPIQSVTARLDTAIQKERKAMGHNPDKKKDDEDETNDANDFKEYVFVIKENKVIMQEVTTGIQDDRYIEITSGLKEGDEVVTGPYNAIARKLENDTEVKVVDKEELYKDDDEK
jgi:HlyD family secretion protein